MKIFNTGSTPSAKGPASYFTGNVRIDCPFCGSANLSGATVTFEPGARTDLEDRLSHRARHALLPGRASR